jgi:DNA-binding transcriptional LysR family regulator
MELRQLAYLEAVIDTGTFAAAAERVHVAQPALWSQVRGLEREWGVPLFERDGRRVRPTAALLALREPLRAALAHSSRLREHVDAARTGLAAPVRIPSSTYPQVARLIAESIATYAAAYPGAPLPVRVPLGTASVYDALAAGEIDLTAGVPPEAHAFQSAPLRDVEIVAVGPGLRTGPIEVRELAVRPLALLTRDFQSRRRLDEAFAAERLVPHVVYEDIFPDALVVLAKRGVATAVLVSDALPLDHRGPAATVRRRGRSLGGQLLLLWRDDATLSTAARRFRDVMLGRLPGVTGKGARRARAASVQRRWPGPRAR